MKLEIVLAESNLTIGRLDTEQDRPLYPIGSYFRHRAYARSIEFDYAFGGMMLTLKILGYLFAGRGEEYSTVFVKTVQTAADCLESKRYLAKKLR